MIEERLSINEKITALMEEQKLSYRHLGELTGISYTTLSRYIKNPEMKISVSNLKLIAKALNVNPMYLMGYIDREPFIERDEENILMDGIIEKLNLCCDTQLIEIYDYINYVVQKGRK